MIRKSKFLSLGALKQIHGFMVVRGFNSDLQALRELLLWSVSSFYGNMIYAYKLFEQICEPDLFIWNTMIRGSSHSSRPSDAIFLYRRMAERGMKADSFTFLFLLKASTKLMSAFAGAQFHGTVVKLGLESDAFLRNALINLHANCGDLLIASALFDGAAGGDVVARSALIAGYARRGKLDIARRLFDESPGRDLVSWNIIIAGYAKQGEMEKARELFDQAPERDVVSWNTMIAGYAQNGLHAQALEVSQEMLKAGERPDEATIVSLLSSCANSGALDIGQRIHCSLPEMCLRSGLSMPVGNALIDMYAKCGSIDRAMEVFKEMKERDAWTWNSIIGGLAFHGKAEECVNLFEHMRMEKVRPNEITFLGVLAACSHGGLVKEGRSYFSLMKNEYRIEPNIKHYGCVVDMLGRAGLLKEAFKLVDSMEIEPSSIIWRALLGACRLHGNIELGEQAKEQILKMKQDASGDYVLLSNMYASTGEWYGVEKLRKLMDARGARKDAACTVIEADNKERAHASPVTF